MPEDYRVADPDLSKGHPLLQERWPLLKARLERDGFRMIEIEVYRPELRQQWLYGAGRTVGQLQAKGISFAFARPKADRVTNAWSATVSAHGVVVRGPGGVWIPAAAALDVDPVGEDGRPWTADDPWDAWLAALAGYGPSVGLVHFKSQGKVSDRPHLQLFPEWSDQDHRLHLRAA